MNNQCPVIASLDLHDQSIYCYTKDMKTEEILIDTNITFKNISEGYGIVLDKLKQCATQDQTSIIVEAGNHGFFPHRYFSKHGYTCSIIDPNSIPKRAVKNDREDARNNLLDYYLSRLKFVHIPTEEIERHTDFLRCRSRFKKIVSKQKQYVTTYLKKNGYQYSASKWTDEYFEWIMDLIENSLDNVQKKTLKKYLNLIAITEESIECIKLEFNEIIQESVHYQQMLRYYIYFPGIGSEGARTLLLEGGGLNRFKSPKAFVKHVGLIPERRTSGNRTSKRINKNGNSHLRSILVRAAKEYTGKVDFTEHFGAIPEPMRTFIIESSNKLNEKYRNMTIQKQPPKVIDCAIARVLAETIWKYEIKIIPQY